MKDNVLLVAINNGEEVEEFSFRPLTEHRFEMDEKSGLQVLRVGESVFPAHRVVSVVRTAELAAYKGGDHDESR